MMRSRCFVSSPAQSRPQATIPSRRPSSKSSAASSMPTGSHTASRTVCGSGFASRSDASVIQTETGVQLLGDRGRAPRLRAPQHGRRLRAEAERLPRLTGTPPVAALRHLVRAVAHRARAHRRDPLAAVAHEDVSLRPGAPGLHRARPARPRAPAAAFRPPLACGEDAEGPAGRAAGARTGIERGCAGRHPAGRRRRSRVRLAPSSQPHRRVPGRPSRLRSSRLTRRLDRFRAAGVHVSSRQQAAHGRALRRRPPGRGETRHARADASRAAGPRLGRAGQDQQRDRANPDDLPGDRSAASGEHLQEAGSRVAHRCGGALSCRPQRGGASGRRRLGRSPGGGSLTPLSSGRSRSGARR